MSIWIVMWMYSFEHMHRIINTFISTAAPGAESGSVLPSHSPPQQCPRWSTVAAAHTSPPTDSLFRGSLRVPTSHSSLDSWQPCLPGVKVFPEVSILDKHYELIQVPRRRTIHSGYVPLAQMQSTPGQTQSAEPSTWCAYTYAPSAPDSESENLVTSLCVRSKQSSFGQRSHRQQRISSLVLLCKNTSMVLRSYEVLKPLCYLHIMQCTCLICNILCTLAWELGWNPVSVEDRQYRDSSGETAFYGYWRLSHHPRAVRTHFPINLRTPPRLGVVVGRPLRGTQRPRTTHVTHSSPFVLLAVHLTIKRSKLVHLDWSASICDDNAPAAVEYLVPLQSAN